jgi:hypothetical protein
MSAVDSRTIVVSALAGFGIGGVVALFVAHPVLWVPVIALAYYVMYVVAFALPLYAFYEIEYRVRRYRWRAAQARAGRGVVPVMVPGAAKRMAPSGA